MTPFGHLPAWAPESLCMIYAAIQCEEDEGDIDLLERLLTDERMEKVWQSINRHAPEIDPVYCGPFQESLYILLSAWLSYPTPTQPRNARKALYKAIADSARQLAELIKATAPDDQSNMLLKSFSRHERYILEIARCADYVSEDFEYFYCPYSGTANHSENSLSTTQTMLIRSINHYFLERIKQPLWQTTALLVEVVLNLPHGTIQIEAVRGCVRTWPKRPENL